MAPGEHIPPLGTVTKWGGSPIPEDGVEEWSVAQRYLSLEGAVRPQQPNGKFYNWELSTLTDWMQLFHDEENEDADACARIVRVEVATAPEVHGVFMYRTDGIQTSSVVLVDDPDFRIDLLHRLMETPDGERELFFSAWDLDDEDE